MSSNNNDTFRLEAEVTPRDDWPEKYIRDIIDAELEERDLGGVDPSRITELESAIDSLTARLDSVEERDGGAGGGGGEVPSDFLADLTRTHRQLQAAATPAHVSSIETGAHEDEGYHSYGAWGTIVSASTPVHWRETTLHADGAGTVTLELFAMEYDPDEPTYNLGDRVATREIEVSGGRETVYPEVTIPVGTVFITRDSADPTADDVVPLKRTRTDVDWDAFNDVHDVPLTFERAWQIGRGPGTDDFESYEEQGWHRTLHYHADMEFGYGSEE